MELVRYFLKLSTTLSEYPEIESSPTGILGGQYAPHRDSKSPREGLRTVCLVIRGHYE